MGQTLSEPLTNKISDFCENERFKVGSSSMQGWRVSMEDAHSHILNLPNDNAAAYFAVYDGHGGCSIAKHVASNLHKVITERPEYKSGDIPGALKNAFLEIDRIMQHDSRLKNDIAGSTAVTCIVKDDKLYCANIGDSRAVASIGGKCYPLSFDHKPNNPLEEARIKDAGGFVEFNRVNGNLALSRAFGDFSFKRNSELRPEQQMVSPMPDIEERTITEEWEYMIIACDGIWDVLSNEEACDLVRLPLANGKEPHKVCEQLIHTCLAPDCNMGGLGCDNMTAILVCFLHGKSWNEFCSRIAATAAPILNQGVRALAIESDSDEESAILPGHSEEEKRIVENLPKKAFPIHAVLEDPHRDSLEAVVFESAVQNEGIVFKPRVPQVTTVGQAEQGDVPATSPKTSIQGSSNSGVKDPPLDVIKSPQLPAWTHDQGKPIRKAKK